MSDSQMDEQFTNVPSGTVTFLFTDIEGSTKLLERLRDQYAVVLDEQRQVLRAAFAKWNGHEIDTQGDSIFVAFTRATDAVNSVMEAQRALSNHTWPQGVEVRVRMGLHTGEPIIARTGYVGMDVHRAARVAAAGHGGQVLLSQTTRELVYQDLPEGVKLRDLGAHMLKDIRLPQQIYQLEIEGLQYDFPALKTLKTLEKQDKEEEPPAPGEPPYKGLQFFDEADAQWFFGREKVTGRLVEVVQKQGFLAVVGASGSGKSSVVRAGLIPILKQNSPGGWQIHVITPSTHPLESLAVSLTHGSESVTATATLIDDLRKDRRSLHLYVQKALAGQKGIRFLLLVDQFEELYTLCREEAERSAFVDNLLYAAGVAGGATTVLIALRADFYEHLAKEAELREAVANQQIYIGAMSADELRQAIEEPARLGGWKFMPGLVDLMLHDVGARAGQLPEPGALPLLSHALLETWKRRRGSLMNLRSYTEAGGVRGAIAKTAESVYSGELTPAQQEMARNIFLRLTELGEGTQDTRRRATISELIPPEPSGDPKDMEEVLVKLADARLITTAEGSVEVAHEALIREWPTLREWLTQDREGLRVHRHLTEAAQEWELLERDTGALYRGSRLAQAVEWTQANPRQLNAQEKAFLDASQEMAIREETEREAQRQRELEAAQRLAEAEKQRAEEQTKNAAKLRQRAWLLTGVLGLAIGLAVAAILLGQQASQRASLATSRELANAAINNLGIDPERSTLLALQALEKADTLEARNALHQALPALHLVRSIQAAEGPVLGVAYSPDGKLVADASYDHSIKIWEVETAKLLHTLQMDNPVYRVAFSPDGKLLATSSITQVIGWDVATGQPSFTFNGHTIGWQTGLDLSVGDVTFSPDGKLLAAANFDGAPTVWDLSTGTTAYTLTGHTGICKTIAFSPDGGMLATGCDDLTVRIWDSKTRQTLFTFEGLSGAVWSARFSPDGKRLAAVTEGASLKVWDVTSGTEVMSLARQDTGGFRGVAWTPDGMALATASYDSVTRLWDAASGVLLLNLPGHVSTVVGVAMRPDGKQLATCGVDQTVKLWDIGPGKELMTFSNPGGDIWAVSYSPDGTGMATTGMDGVLRIWDSSSYQLLQSLAPEGPLPPLTSLAYSPDGKSLASGSINGAVNVWNLQTGKMVFSQAVFTNWVRGLAFSPDGKRLAAGSLDGNALVWDLSTGKVLTTFRGHIHPEGNVQSNGVWSLAFSPDGKRVATGGADSTIRVWEAASGQELLALPGEDKPIFMTGVAFSPDGKLIAGGQFNGLIAIWEATSGKLVRKITAHSAAVARVVFNADGTRLASASFDKLAKVWDVQTGQELATLYGNTKNFQGVTFKPDGKRVATGGGDGMVRIFVQSLAELESLAKVRLTRTLTTAECQQYLHAAQCPAQ